jgi:hypothetical protein
MTLTLGEAIVAAHERGDAAERNRLLAIANQHATIRDLCALLGVSLPTAHKVGGPPALSPGDVAGYPFARHSINGWFDDEGQQYKRALEGARSSATSSRTTTT